MGFVANPFALVFSASFFSLQAESVLACVQIDELDVITFFVLAQKFAFLFGPNACRKSACQHCFSENGLSEYEPDHSTCPDLFSDLLVGLPGTSCTLWHHPFMHELGSKIISSHFEQESIFPSAASGMRCCAHVPVLVGVALPLCPLSQELYQV